MHEMSKPFSGDNKKKKKKDINSLSPAKKAQGVVKVNLFTACFVC